MITSGVPNARPGAARRPSPMSFEHSAVRRATVAGTTSSSLRSGSPTTPTSAPCCARATPSARALRCRARGITGTRFRSATRFGAGGRASTGSHRARRRGWTSNARPASASSPSSSPTAQHRSCVCRPLGRRPCSCSDTSTTASPTKFSPMSMSASRSAMIGWGASLNVAVAGSLVTYRLAGLS